MYLLLLFSFDHSSCSFEVLLFVWIYGLHIFLQDAMVSSSDVGLLIDCVRSIQDIGTRNHGFSLIASLGKACPQLVSESIVDLFVAIGDAIKQVCLNFLGAHMIFLQSISLSPAYSNPTMWTVQFIVQNSTQQCFGWPYGWTAWTVGHGLINMPSFYNVVSF